MNCGTCGKEWRCIVACPEKNEVLSRMENESWIKDAGREGSYVLSAFPKTCGCGAVYRSAAEWRALPYAGIMEVIEIRNCACGSTIGVKLAGKPVLIEHDFYPLDGKA